MISLSCPHAGTNLCCHIRLERWKTVSIVVGPHALIWLGVTSEGPGLLSRTKCNLVL